VIPLKSVAALIVQLRRLQFTLVRIIRLTSDCCLIKVVFFAYLFFSQVASVWHSTMQHVINTSVDQCSQYTSYSMQSAEDGDFERAL